jgi:hypothetical protein
VTVADDSHSHSNYITSNANDTFTGNLTTGADNHITFGPNSTWASYLRVGGNGRTVSGTTSASVVTTNGNLHLDSGTDKGMFLNYYAGTAGVAFGSGASSIVAFMGPDGDLWKGGSDNSGSKYWHAGNDGSGSGLDADLLDGYQLSTTRNAANTVPVRDANGYLQLGWINTTSGSTTSTINKIYASYDDYMRYVTPATLISQLGIWTSGNDGSGSGLDADLLDGLDSTAFLRSKDRTNWNTSPSVIGAVVGQLAWKQYSNNHTIFDASASTTPSGTSCNNTNPDYVWSGTHPTLMGWNGANTYGVRVDSARNADNASLLDSIDSSSFLRSDADDSFSGGLVSTSRDEGIFGTYDSYKTDHIWSMGTAYKNHASGTNFGNLYGLAYKHTNNATGGTMASGHQMVWCQNGTPNAAMGTNIWTSGSIIVGGTVDGRDVSADGAKLDTIATNANNYSLPASPSFTNIYINDYVYHSGDTNTYMGFDNVDNWRVVTGGTTRMQVDNSTTTMFNNISMSNHYLDMNNNAIYGVNQIFHEADTDTYMQFHAADQWRVVVGGSERLEVKNSSPHVLVSGDLNSTSDIRLKDNIKPIENALSDVCRLEGVSFNWKDTGTKATGFIAQQVEPIFPDLVNTNEDDGIKSVNYIGLIGHLVEAIKEQQAQIDALTAKLNS